MLTQTAPTIVIAVLMTLAVSVLATPTPNDDPPPSANIMPVLLDGPMLADVHSTTEDGGGWGSKYDWVGNNTGHWDFKFTDTYLEEPFDLVLYPDEPIYWVPSASDADVYTVSSFV
jgi:hypothetical protein